MSIVRLPSVASLAVTLAVGSLIAVGSDAGGASGAVPESCLEADRPSSEPDETGIADCAMVEHRVAGTDGTAFVRLDVGLEGRIRGFVALDGRRASYFTTAPELFFPQTGNPPPWQRGVAQYRADRGTGVTLLYPADADRWNGKMFFTAHGAGVGFRNGNLKAWGDRFRPSEPWSDISRYERSMLDKGYAVAKSWRSSDKTSGDCVVVLEDGTVLENRNLTQTPHLLLEFARLSERLLEGRLGEPPRRTYWYGHSAGARVGRSINYLPGLNRGEDGRLIDGFLDDDSATGLWLPFLLRDGEDVLLTSAEARREFVPQIDVTHLLYVRTTEDPVPDRVSRRYLGNKRENARILLAKGLGDKHRMYEVRGVSHYGGEYGPGGVAARSGVLPLWPLMDALIDRLDEWVEGIATPPATRSDWAELGDVDGDGEVEHPAIALPEVACPLGVLHPYPTALGERGVGTTGFAAYDGRSLEPLDGRGVLVDMNDNGRRDRRETIAQAWRRLGLLARAEPFSRQRYVDCVESAARRLGEQGFLGASSVARYVEYARSRDLGEPR